MYGKKVLKVISNTITALLFIVLITTIFVFISSKASGEGSGIFGYQLKTVLSGSMEPKIKTGSIIAIKPVSGQIHFNKGEIVTYQTSDGILITHRIFKVKGAEKQYITKGDNNNAPDMEPVLPQNIVGIYTGFTIPYIGYIAQSANSREGSALLLILPGVLLLCHAGFTIWQALRGIESKEKNEGTKVF
ncbi:signal peptidase I SipW [Bacillus sp. OK048]|uniref:signal peptidase I SipW n=1 Tax=Bacillus sp. OK048 TaxID=1882761 RepID=UPI00088B2A89|nr:signal peptidase I [Bacillus sp. OK048]SDM56473.1 signal peptidase, endoplasmic reticulum-type [Bacillus sp. OK048]